MGRRADPEPPPCTVSLPVGVAGPLGEAAADDGEHVYALDMSEAIFEAAAWALSRKQRNRRMHALCGNGPAGSRRTARKRQAGGRAPLLDQQLTSALVQALLPALLAALQGQGLPEPATTRPRGAKPPRTSGAQTPQPKAQPKTRAKAKAKAKAAPAAPSTPTTPPPPAQKETAQPEKAAWQQVTHKKEEVPWTLRSEDWTAATCTVDEIEQAIAGLTDRTEKFERVVLVNDEEEHHMVLALAAELPNCGVTTVQRQKDATRKVPLVAKGRQRLFQAEIRQHQAGSGAPPTLKSRQEATKTAVTARPKAAKTEVIKLYVDKRYVAPEIWNSTQAQPKRAVLTWVEQNIGHDWVTALVDAWGFSKLTRNGKEMITGLLRVKQENRDALIKASGKSGLFVDPFRDAEGVPPMEIEWLPTIVGESPEEHLKRVLKEKPTWGVVRGDRQLGLRKPRDVSAPSLRSWTVQCPRDWSDETVMELLEDTGYTHISMYGAQMRGRLCVQRFRAKAPAANSQAEAICCLYLDEDNETRELWATTQGARQARTGKVQQLSNKGTLRPGAPTFGVEEEKVAKPPATPTATPPAGPPAPGASQATTVVEDSQMENEESDKRAADGDGQPPPARRQAVTIRKRILPPTLSLRETNKEGACLYDAFGQAFSYADGLRRVDHRRARAELVAHLRKYSSDYEGDWHPDDRHDQGSFEEYVTKAAKASTPGGIFELKGLCKKFNATAVVIPEQEEDPCFVVHPRGRSEGGQYTVALHYSRRGSGHWQWLQPLNADKSHPKEITKVLRAPPPAGLRGGGVSDTGTFRTAGTARTAATALTFATAVTSQGAPKRSRGGSTAPATARTGPRRSQATGRPPTRPSRSRRGDGASDVACIGDLGDIEEIELPTLEKQPRRQPPCRIAGQGCFQWQCPHCPFATKTAPKTTRRQSMGYIHGVRRDHMIKFHSEHWAAAKADRGFQHVQFYDAGSEETSPMAWRCPLCKGGYLRRDFDQMQRSTQLMAKHRHKKLRHPKVSAANWHKALRRHVGKSEEQRRKQRQAAITSQVTQQIRRTKLSEKDHSSHELVGYLHPYVRKKAGKAVRISVAAGVRCLRCRRMHHRSHNGLDAEAFARRPCEPLSGHHLWARRRMLAKLEKERAQVRRLHPQETAHFLRLYDEAMEFCRDQPRPSDGDEGSPP